MFIAPLFELICPWVLNRIFYNITLLEHQENKIDYSILTDIFGYLVGSYLLIYSILEINRSINLPLFVPYFLPDKNLTRNL